MPMSSPRIPNAFTMLISVAPLCTRSLQRLKSAIAAAVFTANEQFVSYGVGPVERTHTLHSGTEH